MREVSANTKNPTDGKLGPTWVGPYDVIKVYGLKSMTDPEQKITSSWNTMYLKKYYV